MQTKNIKSVFDQQTDMENKRHNYNAKIGVDYSVSKNSTVGVVINGFINPGKWKSNTNTLIYDPNYNLTEQTKAFTSNNEKWKNFSGNINFRTKLDSAGQELTTDLSAIFNISLYQFFQPLVSTIMITTGGIKKATF
ncbi:MAG: hypothetical protein R2765_11010 [Ferruginibacter sp.]